MNSIHTYSFSMPNFQEQIGNKRCVEMNEWISSYPILICCMGVPSEWWYRLLLLFLADYIMRVMKKAEKVAYWLPIIVGIHCHLSIDYSEIWSTMTPSEWVSLPPPPDRICAFRLHNNEWTISNRIFGNIANFVWQQLTAVFHSPHNLSHNNRIKWNQVNWLPAADKDQFAYMHILFLLLDRQIDR